MNEPSEHKNLKSIVCKVDKIFFHNQDTKETVMSVTSDDGKHYRVLGKIGKVDENYILKAIGSWNKDEKYGWEFQTEYIQTVSTNPLAEESEYLECTILDVKVLKEDTGFASAKGKCSDGKTIRLSGRIAKLKVDSVIGIYGKWKHDETYGDEFQVALWEYKKENLVTSLRLAEFFINKLKESAAKSANATTCNVDENPSQSTGFLPSPNLRDSREIIIPDGVSDIANHAFEGFENLVSVTIPDSVKSIGNEAFKGCKKLASISIPNSVEKIGCGAFQHCESLKSVDIPDSISYIPRFSFYGCSQLENISFPGSTVSIGKCAFSGCTSLKTISIPKSVNSIGKSAFSGCINLASVLSPTPVRILKEDAFEGCPENLIDKTVEVDWDDIAFYNNCIQLPNLFGGTVQIYDKNIKEPMIDMLRRLAPTLPKLIVHYNLQYQPVIQNIEVLHNVVTTLHMKNNLAGLINNNFRTADVLNAIDRVPKNETRVFIPRDMTPFLNFLYEKHAIDAYPIVPIEEYNGYSWEKGALFTLMNDGQPYIVWENFKDSRSTYVFRCTKENYFERRQLVFDYIMTQKTGKRRFLHAKESKNIFGTRPNILVHNNLESWSERLLRFENSDDEEDDKNIE